jgi:DNA primase
MRFSDGLLEEIRQRIPIHEVVGQHVIWDKRKSQPARGDYWACCPFHGEKTPSFHADDRKGIYHCFGCGVSGDHFRFLTEKTGMSFPEAVEKLAGMAGVPMPARDKREEARQEARRSLYDVMESAAQYFEAALSHNIGARARGYLNERAVSAQAQQKFRIGFAPDSRNGLKEHLAANGVSAQEMIDAGLVIPPSEDRPSELPFDRFRNRVIFPITDFRGRVIAFGGRALSPDVPAKYLNSPETDLFKKRLVLYNGQAAREAAKGGKPVIVVEGYLDVIAAVTAGFEGAVAPLGTALTEEHLQLLWRMNEQPILCFDGDSAGQRAAERTAEVVLPLLEPGRTVRIATLPEGLDPDDLIRQQGRNAFADVIDRARSLSDMIWSVETTGGIVPETPEARAALEARLRARADAIRDEAVRRHYRQAFDEKLRAFFAPARPAPQRYEGGRRDWPDRRGFGERKLAPVRLVVSDSLRNSRMLRPGRAAEATPREAAIILTLVNHPSLAENRMEALASLEFSTPAARALMAALLDVLAHDHEISGPDLAATLGGRGFADSIEKMRQSLARQGVWQVGEGAAELDAETGLRHALALHYKSVELNRALKAAETALDVDWTEEKFERLQDIKNQITTVDGTEALIEGFGSLSGRATRGF